MRNYEVEAAKLQGALQISHSLRVLAPILKYIWVNVALRASPDCGVHSHLLCP